MTGRSTWLWIGVGGVVVLVLLLLPLAVGDADGAAGFDGYIQSGTCADPSDELTLDLESEDDADDTDDVEPYVAVGADGDPVTLGYYGSPGVPGFGLGLIYTDQRFSMVITDPDADGDAVACGDILPPDDDRFEEDGVAVAQLLPVGSSDVEGFAVLERAALQRELDITPTRARIVLSTDTVTVPDQAIPGFEGYVQSGRCGAPTDDLQAELESDDDYDVVPFEAVSPESGDPMTVAYYGAAGAPGFGLAAAYTDEVFSVIIEDPESAEPVSCGDILEPDDDEFTEAGLALVQLLPTGDGGVQGYAVLDRAGMQRELDVTPTLVRVLLFAPPATVE